MSRLRRVKIAGRWVDAPAWALALPFDPVPSGFQRWLNARQDWPNNEKRRFESGTRERAIEKITTGESSHSD